MKRLIYTLTVLCLSLLPLSAYAEWYNQITFVAGSNCNTPITVRYNGKSYTVYNTVTINTTGNTYSPSATDSSGNSLRYEISSSTSSKGSDTYHYYTYTFYVRSSYGSSSSDNSGYNSGRNDSYNMGANAGRALGAALFSLGGGEDGDAYPSLQFAPGISRAYGENIKLKYTGYGFHMYASIGKDFLSDSECKDKILWNIGIGSYFAFGGNGNPNMDVSVGLSVGQLAHWEKLSLMVDADYTYWIGRWRRVGIFGGAGLGWGSFGEMFNTDDYSSTGGFAWNLEAGIVIRLANF